MTAKNPPPPRSKPVLYLFMGIVAFTLTFGVIALFINPVPNRKENSSLLLFAAESWKIPLEKIAADYFQETGTRVELSTGDSKTLLGTIESTRRGDLFLPDDDSFLTLARKRHLIGEIFPLPKIIPQPATMTGSLNGLNQLQNVRTNVAVALVTNSKQREAALKLARFIVSEKGLKHFAQSGIPIEDSQR